MNVIGSTKVIGHRPGEDGFKVSAIVVEFGAGGADCDAMAYIVRAFSPAGARELASILCRCADYAEGLMSKEQAEEKL